MSSTRASAISPTMSRFRSASPARRTPRIPDDPIFMLAVRSRRDARQAGPSPKSAAVAIAMPTVKSSTPEVESDEAEADAGQASLRAAARQHHAQIGRERRSRGDRGVGHCQPDERARDRQHEAFGHQLPDDPETAGAQREPDRDLALAPEPAHEHQVGEVDAHDQQHRGHGRAEKQNRSANQGIDPLVVERHGGRAPEALARCAVARKRVGNLLVDSPPSTATSACAVSTDVSALRRATTWYE